MRVLWITQAKISLSDNLAASGGWTIGALKCLVSQNDIEVHYAFLSKEKVDYDEAGVHFWGIHNLNGIRYPMKTEKDIGELLLKLNPDVIHCWGTETPVTVAAVRAAKSAGMTARILINVQGMLAFLVKVLEKSGIPGLKIPITRPIELVTCNSTFFSIRSFRRRMEFEREVLMTAKYYVGRTPIDKAFIEQNASCANYFFCNETLRDTFYQDEKWSLNNMVRHSIFMSDVHYPIKSLEKMLEALFLLSKKYDDVELYIAGQDMFCSQELGKMPWDAIPSWLKRDGYQAYLYRRARKLGIINRVHFIGRQDAEGMKENYLKANVYVSSSIIENESNSLSEAMMLGVPCVASYVGGVVCRIRDGEDGFFYPWNEPWQLADRIMQIFEDDDLAMAFSEKSVEKFVKILDRQVNLETLVKIYKEISLNDKDV